MKCSSESSNALFGNTLFGNALSGLIRLVSTGGAVGRP
jgi:hypothetical protein